MIKLYSKFLDLLEWVEKVILAVSVFVMVIIMVYQVILRYVFSNPNAWSEELARYLFILNVMLAAAIAVRRNSHMQIDILINLFSERVKHIFTIISTIAGIAFMVLLFQYSLGLRHRRRQRHAGPEDPHVHSICQHPHRCCADDPDVH